MSSTGLRQRLAAILAADAADYSRLMIIVKGREMLARFLDMLRGLGLE